MTEQKLHILEVLKSIDGCDSPKDVLAVFKRFIGQLGFERFFINQLVSPFHPFANKAMSFTDWPDDMRKELINNGRMLQDPVVLYAMRSSKPFTWSEAIEFDRRYGKSIVEDARSHNMNDGIMVPLRRPGSLDGGISLATSKLDLSNNDWGDIQLACMHCYYRLEDLHPPFPVEPEVNLAPRERDVLQFAAAGKTFWEMSVIMGTSEAAAKDSMKRAREKLNCVNTTQAVSRAIARDYIVP